MEIHKHPALPAMAALQTALAGFSEAHAPFESSLQIKAASEALRRGDEKSARNRLLELAFIYRRYGAVLRAHREERLALAVEASGNLFRAAMITFSPPGWLPDDHRAELNAHVFPEQPSDVENAFGGSHVAWHVEPEGPRKGSLHVKAGRNPPDKSTGTIYLEAVISLHDPAQTQIVEHGTTESDAVAILWVRHWAATGRALLAAAQEMTFATAVGAGRDGEGE